MLLLISANFHSIPSRLNIYFKNDKAKQNDESSTRSWFRGQPDDSWGLLPSIYRDGPTTFGHNPIAFNDIVAFYDRAKLTDKYYEIFGEKFLNKKAQFMAFMQHSTSCSPLIDFSESIDIAAIFASCSPGNHLLEENHDGLIFGVLKGDRMDDECKETEKDKKIEWAANHFSVFFLEGTINPTTLIYDVPLFLTPLASLMPNYVVIEAPTNDRMKYQKGVLFFFYHCVVFSQTILFPFSNVYGSDVLYVAKIHKAGGKRRCYAAVKKKSGLTFDYLMNPYAYFQE